MFDLFHRIRAAKGCSPIASLINRYPMNRVRLKDVLVGYDVTNYRHVWGSFVAVTQTALWNDPLGACPLSNLAIIASAWETSPIAFAREALSLHAEMVPAFRLSSALHCPLAYVRGFISGHDSGLKGLADIRLERGCAAQYPFYSYPDRPVWLIGFWDGLRVRRQFQ